MDAGKSSGGSSAGSSSGASRSSNSGSKSASKASASKASSNAAKSSADSASSTKDSPKGSLNAKDGVSVSAEAKSKEKDVKSGVNFDSWGDETLQAVDTKVADEKATDEKKSNQKPNAELAASLGDKTLRGGMHNESVRSLQSALNNKLGKELQTDGKFGPNTKAAVREFQAKNGLEVDGIVGPKTREALVGGTVDKAEKPAGLPDNVPVPTPRPDQPGDVTKNTQSPQGDISFGQKLSGAQKEAINTMVSDLKAKGFNVKADDIANFMAVETAGTFSPSIRSGGKKSGAVGLAQFTNIAIKDLNRSRPAGDKLSKSKLASMSFADQSKVVTDYLSTALGRKSMQGKDISAADLYTAVFSPAAIGKSMGSTIYSQSGSARNYQANRSLDTNRDGRITKAELTARLDDWTRRGQALRG
jgi:putative peptidoglycan binding protein